MLYWIIGSMIWAQQWVATTRYQRVQHVSPCCSFFFRYETPSVFGAWSIAENCYPRLLQLAANDGIVVVYLTAVCLSDISLVGKSLSFGRPWTISFGILYYVWVVFWFHCFRASTSLMYINVSYVCAKGSWSDTNKHVHVRFQVYRQYTG